MNQQQNPLLLLLLILGLVFLLPRIAPTPIDQPTTETITRLTYVYEIRDGGVPPALLAALSAAELSRDSVRVSVFEEDSTDGAGQVPEQFQRAKAAADEYGKPCLVAESAARVVRVRRNPTGPEDVRYALEGNLP
jgi:hypothetical protein